LLHQLVDDDANGDARQPGPHQENALPVDQATGLEALLERVLNLAAGMIQVLQTWAMMLVDDPG